MENCNHKQFTLMIIVIIEFQGYFLQPYSGMTLFGWSTSNFINWIPLFFYWFGCLWL